MPDSAGFFNRATGRILSTPRRESVSGVFQGNRDLVLVDGYWPINLDRVTANVHLHGASPNDLKLHFIPIRRCFN